MWHVSLLLTPVDIGCIYELLEGMGGGQDPLEFILDNKASP